MVLWGFWWWFLVTLCGSESSSRSSRKFWGGPVRFGWGFSVVLFGSGSSSRISREYWGGLRRFRWWLLVVLGHDWSTGPAPCAQHNAIAILGHFAVGSRWFSIVLVVVLGFSGGGSYSE